MGKPHNMHGQPERANSLVYMGKMVGRARFERATNWLKANCSTN